MEKSGEASKKRILETAARIFAQKGYSGARIDEIAKEAQVNKALIYYYFESKESILNELFTDFFRESTDKLLKFVERGGFGKNAEENKQLFEAEYESYLASNAPLLKIIFMESLKEGSEVPPLFRLVDLERNGQDARITAIRENGAVSDTDMRQTMVTEFFTGVVPFVAYVMFREKWCQHFNISEDELQTCFSNAMQETHEQYHLNLKKSKRK